MSSYYVTYVFWSEYKFCTCLNAKELLAQNRCDIWSLSDCNGIRTHNHLVRKRTLVQCSFRNQVVVGLNLVAVTYTFIDTWKSIYAFDLLAGALNVFSLRVQSKDTEARTVSVGVVLTLLPTFNRCLVSRKQLLYVQTDIFETFRENLVWTYLPFAKKL